MAGRSHKESYVGNYIANNIYIRYFFFLVVLIAGIGGLLFLLSSTQIGYEIAKKYNKILVLISFILSKIPIYNLWTQHFNAYVFYFQYNYELNNQFLQSPKEWKFLYKFYMELLPLFTAIFFYLKYFFDLRMILKDYPKTLKYRNLKPVDNPLKKLEKGLWIEGVDNNEYNPEQLEVLKKFYHKKEVAPDLYSLGMVDIFKIRLKNNIKDYYDSLLKMRLRLTNEKEWNEFFEKIIDQRKQPYEYLKLFVFKDIDYELLEEKEILQLKKAFSWNMHFKYLPVKKKYVSREFYIDTLKKEVDWEELYKYYYTTLLFWLNKNWINFPMYLYTIKLDVPKEWKKLNKWTVGLNAPGKVNVIIGKTGTQLKQITVDLYYRLFMFRNYIGNLDIWYMIDYIELIDQKFGVK